MEYSNNRKDWVLNLDWAKALPEDEEHINIESQTVFPCYPDESFQELIESQGKQQHNVLEVVNPQAQVMFESIKQVHKDLKQMHEDFKEHNGQTATAIQLQEHDASVKKEIQQKKDELEQAIGEFKNHLKQFSARKRMQRYSLFFVISFFVMTLINISGREILINSKWSSFALFLSLFFFVMASFIPEAESDNGEIK